MTVQAFVTRLELNGVLRDFRKRIRALEAAVSITPAENSQVWVADGTSMETLIGTPDVTLRGYKISNSATVGAFVALYDLADPGDIDDGLMPDDGIRIPPRLTANLDGSGNAKFVNGLCFAIWGEIDPGGTTSGGNDIDFDGSPDVGTLLISFQWDGGT